MQLPARDLDHRGWTQPRKLPHFDSAETIQFITFRLVDSLPASVDWSATTDQSRRLVERELDRFRGACHLADRRVANIVEGALRHFDGQRYRLFAWCEMPNHVHTAVQQYEGHRLASIVQSWKAFTAREANAVLSLDGQFWQRDYFDRFMRNEIHLERTIAYVEANPVHAGLVSRAENWPWSSARYRCEKGQ